MLWIIGVDITTVGKAFMEFIHYDREKKLSTLKLTNSELTLIASVLSGVRNTFYMQDATILGIDEPHLDELNKKVHSMITEAQKTVAR